MTSAVKGALDKVLTTSDIATLAGVERSTVSNWKKRYPDEFPKPIHEIAGNDIYDRAEVVAWLQANARRRVDHARRVLKEAKNSLAKAEASLDEVRSMQEKVRRLRK